MLKKKSLTVDFTQEDTLLSILPCLPIVSSHTVGWDKIQLAHYRQPPHSVPEHCSPQHIVCINVGSPVVLEQVVDGHSETVHSVPGDIGIYPAHLWQAFCWDKETEFLQLYLEPTLLTLVSNELCGSDRIELIPQLTSFFDPLIQNIGLALKTALEIDGLRSCLYAESMVNALAVHLLSRYSTRERVIRHYAKGLSQQHLNQVVDYIKENLDRIAHLFKQATKVSPHQYIIQCRVERTKKLLLKGDLTIAEVAHIVGFASQGHLNYHFKRLVGMTSNGTLQVSSPKTDSNPDRVRETRR